MIDNKDNYYDEDKEEFKRNNYIQDTQTKRSQVNRSASFDNYRQEVRPTIMNLRTQQDQNKF